MSFALALKTLTMISLCTCVSKSEGAATKQREKFAIRLLHMATTLMNGPKVWDEPADPRLQALRGTEDVDTRGHKTSVPNSAKR